MEAIASFVQPGDTVVDVGGGAGRICLPLGPSLWRTGKRRLLAEFVAISGKAECLSYPLAFFI